MIKLLKKLVQRGFRTLGYDVVPAGFGSSPETSWETSVEDREVLRCIQGIAATSFERNMALVDAVRYLVHGRVSGACVECGVWKGGSSMAIALTLMQEKDSSRDLYLFDTFEGMTPPTSVDRAKDGKSAEELLAKTSLFRCIAPLDEVRRNMAATGYPNERIHYIQGRVEDTIPAHAPQTPIALLRLDTDWYESTKHELLHLFPLVSKGGIVIIDDYGHWQGARKAVDEYLGKCHYLHRIDYTGRLIVKT